MEMIAIERLPLLLPLLVLSAMIFCGLASVDAQKSDFKIYENRDYSIKIEYPSQWQKSENNLANNQIVIFSAPEIEEKESSVSTIVYIPARVAVATQQPPSANMTLENFTNYFIESIYDSPVKYKIINTSKTTLAGKEAEEVTLYEYLNEGTLKVKRVVSLFDNNTAFMIKYGAEPGKFSKYLPVAEQMINSFQTTDFPNDNSKQDQTSLTVSKLSNDSQIETLGSPEKRVETLNLAELPEFITVIASSDEMDFPLAAAYGNYLSKQGEKNEELQDITLAISDWNPKFTFQFIEGSKVGLINVNSVLVGQVKSYDSIEQALKASKIWREIPLNEQVVLRLDHKGINFMIIEVLFENGASGLYNGVFDMQASLDKKTEGGFLRDDLRADKTLEVAKSSKPKLSKDLYWDGVIPIVCNDLDGFGFRVCN